ncbi:MAG TPA: VapC toxin family PIN domain ribonuclease, partial [Gemmatimonadota bacterium]|nr:VapC toxin family PIN domain ribonuclease [Gemmatimonadota bacterium]
ILEWIETVRVTDAVLLRASRPMPVSLGTLDSIHLATALLWTERTGDELAVATHDRALARGARAFGLRVHGAE